MTAVQRDANNIGAGLQAVINGRFLEKGSGGVTRYATEIVLALDKLVRPGEIRLICPPLANIDHVVNLINIEAIFIGKRGGVFWEQRTLPRYCRRHKCFPVNLCNSAPYFTPGIVVAHDCYCRSMPETVPPLFRAWYRLLLASFEKRALGAATVSETSRRTIGRYYPRLASDAPVLYNSWQHMQRIEEDTRLLDFLDLQSQGYYLAMGSKWPNKNFKWFHGTAKLNPSAQFVATGNRNILEDLGLPPLANLTFTGHVSDGELKTLMRNCRLFLCPSIQEGFGLPPLEAIACGAKVALADIEVFHEVYANDAVYFNCDDPCNNIEALAASAVDGHRALSRYAWGTSAQRLLGLIRSLPTKSKAL